MFKVQTGSGAASVGLMVWLLCWSDFSYMFDNAEESCFVFFQQR